MEDDELRARVQRLLPKLSLDCKKELMQVLMELEEEVVDADFQVQPKLN